MRWRRVSPLLVLTACEAFAFADRDLLPRVDGGATTSTATGGSFAIQCLYPFDCPGEDTECHVRACHDGVCGLDDTAEGTATSAQVAGDCKRAVCDGDGGVKQVDDDGDAFDDHDPCTLDLCIAGAPRSSPSVASSSCGSGVVCDGAGSCVACVTAAQCATGYCADNRCVAPSCLDHVKDDDETAVDCGGSACGPCDDGAGCAEDRDCRSGRCDASSFTCAAPSCADAVKNGVESGVDCGGGCAMLCALGEGCARDDDCLGGSCSGSVCLPSCVDGVRDGAETDVDCGGYACAPCWNGRGCVEGSDCASGICRAGRCMQAACVDGTKDGDETDVDCGGTCAPCGGGEACVSGADCASGVCAGTLCV